MNKPMIEFNGQMIEDDSEHDEDWLDDDSITDEEKLAYFKSLDWQPGRNLANEFGITSPEEHEEFLRKQAGN